MIELGRETDRRGGKYAIVWIEKICVAEEGEMNQDRRGWTWEIKAELID